MYPLLLRCHSGSDSGEIAVHRVHYRVVLYLSLCKLALLYVVVNVVAVRLVVGHAVDEQPLNEVYLGIDGAVAAELVPENSCKVKVFAVVVRRIRVSDVFCDYLLLLPEDGQPLLRYPECIRICLLYTSDAADE